MSSKVGICNLALTSIGGDRITSITDNTNTAKNCNAIFDDVADYVMAAHEWSTAVSRATLNRLSDTPSFGWAYQYQLPVSPYNLRVLDINELRSGDYPFRIEGDALLTDEATAKIRYIGRITNTQQYGPFLTEAVVARLAAELAYPVTGNATLTAEMFKKAAFILEQSIASDGCQGSGFDIISPDLIDPR